MNKVTTNSLDSTYYTYNKDMYEIHKKLLLYVDECEYTDLIIHRIYKFRADDVEVICLHDTTSPLETAKFYSVHDGLLYELSEDQIIALYALYSVLWQLKNLDSDDSTDISI